MDQTNQNVVPLDGAGRPIKGDLKDRAVTRGHKMTYYADQIKPRGHNPRMWELPRNRAKVIEFAQSIYDGGVRSPITVVKEGPDILIEHGETRWLSVKLLEGEDVRGVLVGQTDPKVLRLLGLLPKKTVKIPAVSGPKRNELDRLTDTVVHNTGNQFADLEMARIIEQYMEKGKSQLEIADILGGEPGGWTQTRVSHIYQLKFASPKLRELLANDVVQTTTIVNAMREYKENAEKYVLGAIADAKAKAAAQAKEAETEAKEAQAEVERIIAEKDEGLIVPGEGRRAISKLEHAQRRAHLASERAEKAKKIVKQGPPRITGRDIDMAMIRRKPGAKVSPSLSKAGIMSFIDGVQFEAQYSTDPNTRDRMNLLLKKFDFPELAPRVDDAGQPLPLPEETQAAA